MIDSELNLATARGDLVEPLGEVSIPRLYAYHRVLRAAQACGQDTITSHGMAALLGHTIASTQIRKDLSALRPLGRRGQGYAIAPLLEQLGRVLGLEQDWRIAIVGFGYLGRAFASFIDARERRFRIAAIFDRSEHVVGQTWHGIVVHDASRMDCVMAETACNIAVIAVPASEAAACAQRAVDLGARAILNFAPTPLDVRAPVVVRNIDLAGEMAILTHRLSLEMP